MKRAGKGNNVVVCVPSGNFGNITAGLFGFHMGLPVKRFIAANNRNDIFMKYLQSGIYEPKPSIQTIANAMDVGDPSNFARILDLYGNDVEKIRKDISAYSYNDDRIRDCIGRVYKATGYILDPHGACAYMGLEEGLQPGENGIMLETAHPAKFPESVEPIIGRAVEVPTTLQRFLSGKKQSVEMSSEFGDFKVYLENAL